MRRRLRRLGLATVAGQLAFLGLAVPTLRWSARGRIREIYRQHGLQNSPPGAVAARVSSVNSAEARTLIQQYQPNVVVVNGTRVISHATLAAITCPIINMHSGITPLYRGVHGGYWALAERRPELAGTTVHLVDRGIDTGTILGQARLQITRRDSFVTYPHLHTAAGLPVLLNAVQRALEGCLSPSAGIPELESRLRYHPTLWGYLYRRLRYGVR